LREASIHLSSGFNPNIPIHRNILPGQDTLFFPERLTGMARIVDARMVKEQLLEIAKIESGFFSVKRKNTIMKKAALTYRTALFILKLYVLLH
jgi:hypothetical protein